MWQNDNLTASDFQRIDYIGVVVGFFFATSYLILFIFFYRAKPASLSKTLQLHANRHGNENGEASVRRSLQVKIYWCKVMMAAIPGLAATFHPAIYLWQLHNGEDGRTMGDTYSQYCDHVIRWMGNAYCTQTTHHSFSTISFQLRSQPKLIWIRNAHARLSSYPKRAHWVCAASEIQPISSWCSSLGFSLHRSSLSTLSALFVPMDLLVNLNVNLNVNACLAFSPASL